MKQYSLPQSPFLRGQGSPEEDRADLFDPVAQSLGDGEVEIPHIQGDPVLFQPSALM